MPATDASPEIPGFQGELRCEESLSKHTYYRIGGPAQYLALPRTQEDLDALARWARAQKLPLFFLGSGSNLLVSDAGWRGLVIKSMRLNTEVSVVSRDAGSAIVRTGAGLAISNLLREAGSQGWSGFEIWAGIPGTVGGAVAMNAGTHLGETREFCVRVEAFDTDTTSQCVYAGQKLKFEYRKNLFLPKTAMVLSADWRVRFEDPAQVKLRIDETLSRRKATQPIDRPSCGSVFKNPLGQKSWEVIDKLGLRGYQVGGAQISEKHSNFIVNLGGATAADVLALIELVQKRAHQELGVTLDREVVTLGF